jgi:tetratricopeptide (TPR) repeat protein
VKGKSERVVAFEALGVKERPDRTRRGHVLDALIVGRQLELAIARRSVDELIAGRGGILLLTGDIGVGKSRMVAEIRAMLTPDGVPDRDRWLEGRCVSFGENLPYWPYRDLLLGWLGPIGALGAQPAAAIPERLLERLGPTPDDLAPYLTRVMGAATDVDVTQLGDLSPEAIRFRTFEAVGSFIERLAHDQPIVVALDDLQWADPTSVALTDRLLSCVETSPVLFVLATRSEGVASQRASLTGETARPRGRTRAIHLTPLDDDDLVALMEQLVGVGTLPGELERRLLDVAEGNPFFLEESIQALIDAGAVVRGGDSHRFDHDIEIDVPNTVEQALVSRIDRLSPGCRDALTGAAVIGRRFEPSLLAEVLGIDPGPALDELRSLDLLREDDAAPRRTYRFKHALIREAAYGTLLRKQRRELHRRTAIALETLLADRPEERFGLLAHHYRLAGESRQALANHRRAAEASARGYAVREALDHYTAALEIAMETADAAEVLPLLLARGRVAAHGGDSVRARDDFAEALRRAREDDDALSVMSSLSELGFALAGAADYRAAVPLLEEALGLAERLEEREAEVEVLSRLSIVETNQLRFDRSAAYGERALVLARALDHEPALATAMDAQKQVAAELGDLATLRDTTRWLEASCSRRGDLWRLQFVVFESAFVPMAAGRWDEAVRLAGAALALCRRIDDRGNEALYLGAMCWFERARGRYGRALEVGNEAVAAASATGHVEWMAWASAALGWTFQDLFLHDEAAERFRIGLAAAEAAGAEIHRTRCLAHLAWSEWQLGMVERSLDHAERGQEALGRVRAPAGRAFLLGSSGYVSLARLRLAQGDPVTASELLTPVVAAADASGWSETAAAGSLVLARCRAALGDAEGAWQAADHALEVAEANELPGVVWEALASMDPLAGPGDGREKGQAPLDRARREVARLAESVDDAEIAASFRERAEASFAG